MNKKLTIIIFACIISVLTACASVTGINLSPYEQQIDLGYKFLEEEKYEEAILAFNKAIEIDVKQDKAYIGLADTYVNKWDENSIDDANNALTLGYEQSKSENIILTYIRLADFILDKSNNQWAVQLLEFGYNLTNDERIKSKIDIIIEKVSLEFMKNLFSLANKDINLVIEEMKKDEYLSIANYATYDEPLFYSPHSDKSNKNGKGIGIYRCIWQDMYSEDSWDNLYLYYGDYKEDNRSEDGIWIDVGLNNVYIFDGEWANDMPNGYGETKSYGYLREGYDYNPSNYYEYGNLINGLWDGDVKLHFYDTSQDTRETEYVQVDNGIVKIHEVEVHDNSDYISYWFALSDDENKRGFGYIELTYLKYGIMGFSEGILQ